MIFRMLTIRLLLFLLFFSHLPLAHRQTKIWRPLEDGHRLCGLADLLRALDTSGTSTNDSNVLSSDIDPGYNQINSINIDLVAAYPSFGQNELW